MLTKAELDCTEAITRKLPKIEENLFGMANELSEIKSILETVAAKKVEITHQYAITYRRDSFTVADSLTSVINAELEKGAKFVTAIPCDEFNKNITLIFEI